MTYIIQHIKFMRYLIILLIIFSCKKSNDTIISIKPEKDKISLNSVNEDFKFSYYDCFAYCDNPYQAYTKEEAKLLFSKTIFYTKNIINTSSYKVNQNKLDILCLERELKVKIKEVNILKTNMEWPLDEGFLINDKYFVTSKDGYYFLFIKESNNHIVNKNSIENEGVVNEVLSKKKQDSLTSNKKYENIFNTKLTGLVTIDKEEKNIYSKYGLDGSIECFCNSLDIYIDLNNQQLILYNHCDLGEIIDDFENIKRYNIINYTEIGDKYNIELEGDMLLEITKETYSLLNVDFRGSDFKNIKDQLRIKYTSKPEKFVQYDCGDFEG